ncbi:MAG: cohesin domain-containing protein [Candidatus Dojkabacteria bacterium]|nr:cohesin domain-containing protein [Candidatus Dojkabacteria bacterium]
MTTRKIISIFIGLLCTLLFPVSKVFAGEPMFSIYPKGGNVSGGTFTVDILLDSAEESLVSARFTLVFDPEYLELTKAERNNALFDQWPSDETTIDNEYGVIMLTGFTQSGSGSLYKTGSTAGIIARLTFKALKKGTTSIDWEYSGNHELFKTSLMKDGSPPTNVLDSKPESATFSIGGVINPQTAIPMDKIILVLGVVLILFGALMVFAKPRNFNRTKGTVVMYGK